MNDETRQELATNLYDNILQVANRLLRNSKMFSIEVLRLENPSYTEIATQLRELCGILETLSNEDEEFTVAKAYEYARNVKDIAEAIENGDEEELQRHVEALDGRPFL